MLSAHNMGIFLGDCIKCNIRTHKSDSVTMCQSTGAAAADTDTRIQITRDDADDDDAVRWFDGDVGAHLQTLCHTFTKG